MSQVLETTRFFRPPGRPQDSAMTLREQLDSDLKDAMRAKDAVKLSTIRGSRAP